MLVQNLNFKKIKMKKLVYLLIVLGVTVTGCNPIEDINNDIDAQPNPVQGEVDYIFTTEDYAIYDTELDGEEYFETQDVADLIIPGFLAEKYPFWGEGSLVNVGFNLFDETLLETMETSETLSNLNEIDSYLSSNYEEADNGTFVELAYSSNVLSYTLSNGDVEDIANALISKYPDPAESAANFGNFDRRPSNNAYWSDSMILEGLNILLGNEYSVGQVVVATFPIYDGGTNFSESFTIQNNGFGFSKLDVEATGTTAIEYTLTGTDYDTIALDLAVAYPLPAENLGQFGSFDVRVGSSDNAWTSEMILEGLNIVLPVATEGDVYAVTYAIYNGSVTTETMTLLYSSGSYIANETTIEVTAVVAKKDGDWEFPYVFTDADYDILGQSYGNFDSGSIYKLDIFLEDLYPYAQAGDVAIVQYDYYSGSTSTEYGQSIFDGDNWNLTPDVIETAFQYGFENGEWVPDNTINYTLLGVDITLISNALIDVYPGPADNVGFFGSFDRRTSSANYWNDDMLLEAFNILLNARNPSAQEGQKYAVTFVVYDGTTNSQTKSLIKIGGQWVYNE